MCLLHKNIEVIINLKKIIVTQKQVVDRKWKLDTAPSMGI